MKQAHTCHGMLTLECPTPVNLTLDKDQASELTALVAKDLYAVLGIHGDSALVVCGALFATEQLLQPQLPVQQHITQYASAAFQGAQHDNQVLSIGSHQGLMPAGLQPLAVTQPLMHIPFCLYTDEAQLAEAFEADLMHKGMISPPTYQFLHALLNKQNQVRINHANYMTYLDLVAMMHNHYEQLGLSHVWQIIETAILNEQPKQAVVTHTNNHFYLVDHLLFTPFFSWSQFHQFFPELSSQDYINWLMAQRLSVGAFGAHGLEIKSFIPTDWPFDEQSICLGRFEKNRIKTSFWTEQRQTNPSATSQDGPVVTYYEDARAGLVTVQVRQPAGECAALHYPITPNGINDIQQQLDQAPGQPVTTIDFITNNQQLL